MNGYKTMAEIYEKSVELGKMTAEQAEPQIRVYEFLASCDKSDLGRIIDSAALNDFIKAYTQKACEDAGLDKEQQAAVSESLRMLLDTMTAREVLQSIDKSTV